jgi:hypothetical protein
LVRELRAQEKAADRAAFFFMRVSLTADEDAVPSRIRRDQPSSHVVISPGCTIERQPEEPHDHEEGRDHEGTDQSGGQSNG